MNVGGGGLASLIAKLVGLAPKADAAAAKGMLGTQQPEGAKKGEPLAEGVLAGLGYSAEDKANAQKNVSEKENVARFLRDPEVDKLLKKEAKEAKEAAQSEQPDKGAENKTTEQRERQDVQRQEVRRDEKAEDARAFAKEQQQQQEAKETQKHEAEHRREQEKDEEKERQQAQAWGWDEPDRERDEDQERGAYQPDIFGDGNRCRASLDDGGRCLRRPVEGTNYCREHAAGAIGEIDPI